MSILSLFRGGLGSQDPTRPDKRLSSSFANLHQAHMALPEDDQGWVDRYNWLHRWYEGLPYDDQDVKALRLFKSVDKSGDTIAMAQRLYGDFRFVVNTDVYALCGGAWSLNGKKGENSAHVDLGQQVWARSGLQAHKASWVRSTAIMGDGWLEPVRFVDGYRLVFYDCRHCVPEYGPDGQTLQKLTVRIPYLGPPDEAGMRAMHIYTRVLTPDGVAASDTDRDGAQVANPMESGAHNLGIVNAVHLRMEEVAGLPEHSLSAGHGLELPMATLDSFVAQIRAVNERYANPTLVAKGFKFGADDTNFQMLGRYYDGLPEDAEVSYLETTMAGLVPMWEIVKGFLDDTRSTVPEFTLAGSGANTSGRALEFRADQFRRKMLDASQRIHAEIARVTHMAVLMGEGIPWDGADEGLRIMAPPPLPVDRPAVVTQAQALFDGGLLQRKDAVKLLQTVGIVDEAEDAEKYASALEAAENDNEADAGDLRTTALAAQQLELARERAIASGDTVQAARLGAAGAVALEQLIGAMVANPDTSSGQPVDTEEDSE